VQSREDLLSDPQFLASGALVDMPDGISSTTMVATGVDCHGTPWSPPCLAPVIGEHSVEILTELGRGQQVPALIASDVVGIPEAE